MGTAVKYLAVVDSRFWETEGMSPNAMSDGDITFTWDATDGQSTAPGDAAVLTAFSSADAAIRCRAGRHQKERDELYYGRFTALYPDFRQHVQHGGFYDWVGDPWTLAGYSFPAPGQITTQGPLLHHGLGRLHFAGEHTCYQFVGYMEGGLNSGAALAKRMWARDGAA
jgi:monoamine oxidase